MDNKDLVVQDLEKRIEELEKSQSIQREKNDWAGAGRDVFLAGIARGQTGLLLSLAIVGIMVWRLPAEGLSSVVTLIINNLVNGKLVGWLLFIAAILCWALHIRQIGKIHKREIERTSAEKTELQKQTGIQVQKSGM